MPVTAFEVGSRRPFAAGESFGEVGTYERIDGRVHFAVDPQDPSLAAIVDLEHAPTDVDGLVRWSADATLLAPMDIGAGNGTLILDVPNRGRSVASMLSRVLDRSGGVPDNGGDGFLFRRGFSLLSVAWQSDVDPQPPSLSTELPVAEGPDGPLRGQAQVALATPVSTPRLPLTVLGNIPFAPQDLDEHAARLLVRDRGGVPYREVPRASWRLLEGASGQPFPYLLENDEGFAPGCHYLLVYTAVSPAVTGAGLVALRDAAAFARSGADGLLGGDYDRVIAYGVSQTGRALRQMLSLGLTNLGGAPAIDGVYLHIAGARLGEFNHRFALPSAQSMLGFGFLPPFSFVDVEDDIAGDVPGLMTLATRTGPTPKVIASNSSWEYWRGDAALSHVHPDGTRDLPEHPDTRTYLWAGTQHIGGVFPLARELPDLGLTPRYPVGVVDPSALTRAAFVALDEWLRDGTEPPPSSHPRVADGTVASRRSVLDRFATLPGIEPPDPDRLTNVPVLDLGDRAEHGVGAYPPREGRAYPDLVAAIDDDFNEVAGVRLPDVAVPVGTHTGWNTEDPERGDPAVAPAFVGLTHYFAPNDDARSTGDPRLSLAARYASRDDYQVRVEEVARKLVAERRLLAEDEARVVAAAMARYDEASGGPTADSA